MSNKDAATVAGAVLIVLDVVTVAGRFYSRWFTKAGFGWDDWTILIALLTCIIAGALTIWASTVSSTGPAAASDFDPGYVSTPADILYTKITFSTSVLYYLVTCTTKISLLLLLHRIFAVSRPFRVQIYSAGAAVLAYWTAATLADCLNCVPLRWTWLNGSADPRYCVDYNAFWLATGVIEGVIDLVILALPLGMVYGLHLDRSRKFGVAGVFLLGGFVLCSGVAKVVLSYVPHSREPDSSRAALWTAVHLHTGIICANMSPSWPLLVAIARAGAGSWARLSSVGRRWYSLGGAQTPAADEGTGTGTVPPSTPPGDKSRGCYRAATIEVDYKLPCMVGMARVPTTG
ncbi:hypothetical protein VPNG_04526 [Cytospora leucostoma]|uniref:Rhodopsin domain-containing protein n=1 Tax=Cytospora leucostoma TaxID=1230097 RepID=A0A423XCF7_9PEZI|nr:hypothetical protein VPNG_04526 [Cytospora leucostoma]